MSFKTPLFRTKLLPLSKMLCEFKMPNPNSKHLLQPLFLLLQLQLPIQELHSLPTLSSMPSTLERKSRYLLLPTLRVLVKSTSPPGYSKWINERNRQYDKQTNVRREKNTKTKTDKQKCKARKQATHFD